MKKKKVTQTSFVQIILQAYTEGFFEYEKRLNKALKILNYRGMECFVTGTADSTGRICSIINYRKK